MSVFGTITAPLLISYSTGPFGAAGGALSLLGTPLIYSNGTSVPLGMPAGNTPWTLSTWVQCAAGTTSTTSFMGVLEWGAAGDSGGLVAPSTAALVVGGVNGGIVTSLAGGGVMGYTGPGSTVNINSPRGVGVIPSSGYIVFSDSSTHIIRSVSPTGVVWLVAGGGMMLSTSGYSEGLGSSALFNQPSGLAVNISGGITSIFVADSGNHRIRKVTYSGDAIVQTVSTFAGGNPSYSTGGFSDGTGTSAAFYNPQGIAVIPSGVRSGYLVVADSGNARVRLISPGGVVTTLAGGGLASQCCADGTGSLASFSGPQNLAVIPSSGAIVVTDPYNQHVRLVMPDGRVTTFAGTSNPMPMAPIPGAMQGSYVESTGTNAGFNIPQGIAVLPTSECVLGSHLLANTMLIRNPAVSQTLSPKLFP